MHSAPQTRATGQPRKQRGRLNRETLSKRLRNFSMRSLPTKPMRQRLHLATSVNRMEQPARTNRGDRKPDHEREHQPTADNPLLPELLEIEGMCVSNELAAAIA